MRAKPWLTEPNRVEWKSKKTGFDCLMVRGPAGAWCGYVGVPKGHKYFGVPYQDCEDKLSVHGGLTYSNECQGHICHDAPNEVWWLGFDCAHSGDLCPRFMDNPAMSSWSDGIYRDENYVKQQCEALAEQLV